MSVRENGAVSIFIVLFSALLMTIISVSFVRLMIGEQQQSTISNLSKSAYDSAEAGIEDAKRLLLLHQSCEEGNTPNGVDCGDVALAISSRQCDTLISSGLVGATGGGNEVLIKQDQGDEVLDQAYTCVTVTVDTADYLGELGENESLLIPLDGVSSFNEVEISWFDNRDIEDTNDPTIDFPASGLPPTTNWQPNYPSLLRTQLVQFGSDFTFSDFNNGRNSSTLFLYPVLAGGLDPIPFSVSRLNPNTAPENVNCLSTVAGGGYACNVTLSLPDPINGNATNRTAFLYLTSLYNSSHFRVQLKNSSVGVNFDAVQPEIDATGRANDVFRRVVSRVELRNDLQYPDAELYVGGDLCKDFTVTGTDSGYSDNCP